MSCSSRFQRTASCPVSGVSGIPDGVGAEEGQLAAVLSDADEPACQKRVYFPFKSSATSVSIQARATLSNSERKKTLTIKIKTPHEECDNLYLYKNILLLYSKSQIYFP